MYKEGDPITDGITNGVEDRKRRGLEIAAIARIDRNKDGTWLVPSVTNPRPTRYQVKYDPQSPVCTCEDFSTRRCKCKHIWAVSFVLYRESNHDNGTSTEWIAVKETRRTYPQDWPAYNAAQVNEKRHFQTLLHSLCKDIPEPSEGAEKPVNGRPPLPLSDQVF